MEEENTGKPLTTENLLERYAQVEGVSLDEAAEQVGAETVEEMLEKIKKINEEKISQQFAPMNRKQRRALAKKNKGTADTVSDFAKKLAYINMIQKLRELNKKENEANEDSTKDN